MADKTIYYFTFDRNCINPRTEVNMQPYWVELHGADTKAEARDTMIKLYACGFTTHLEKDLDWLKDICKGGCYEQIHLPLPEDVHLEFSDPFFSAHKKSKSSTGEKRRRAKYKSMVSGHSHAYGNGGYVQSNGSNSVSKSIKLLSKLEQRMIIKGVTLRQISNATGVSYVALKYLCGGDRLRMKAMIAIADYLGVDPKDII